MSDSHTTPRPSSAAAPSAGRGVGEGAPFTDGASLLDVLDRVLERGIVVEPSATGALPALDLSAGEASLVIASTEPIPGGAAGWDALAETAAAGAGAERETPPARAADELWRSGEHAALKRQFERLNA